MSPNEAGLELCFCKKAEDEIRAGAVETKMREEVASTEHDLTPSGREHEMRSVCFTASQEI